MKKLLSVLIAAMLVMSLCVTSFAAPTIDYVFKSETDYYLFGSTDSVVDDLGVEISSANVKAQTITFSEDGTPELLNTLNDVKKFGFKIGNPEDVIGNTIVFTPFYEVGGVKTEGKSYTAFNNGTDAAVIADEIGIYKSTAGQISVNATHSIKDTIVYAGSTSPIIGQGKLSFSGWAPEAPNYKSVGNSYLLLQFALTEEMAESEDLKLTFGVCDAAYNSDNTEANYYETKHGYPKFANANGIINIYELEGTKNDWTQTHIKKLDNIAGEDGITKTLIGTIDAKNGIKRIEQGSSYNSHQHGYRLESNADFAESIKAKVNAGQKFITLALQVSDVDHNNDNTYGLTTYTKAVSAAGGGYSNRTYPEPFAPAIRW